jgi:carbamoyl-phosphate synthase small subunit
MKALLALEDGLTFKGEAFGEVGEAFGEMVFNTSMTGYQEVLTDPSYKGQIVAMTYPHIGNYGINAQDVESKKVQVEGFVVKELSPVVSNYRATMSLDDYLKKSKVLAIEGVDTRALTKHLRDFGAKKAVISTEELDPKKLVKKAQDSPSIVGRDLVKEVTCAKAYDFNELPLEGFSWPAENFANRKSFDIVCIDTGVKWNILRKLKQHGFNVRVVPADTKSKEILAQKPKGVFLANGPGDPEPLTYLTSTVKELLGQVPVFGICLGHQILSQALGGKTYKLKFGHRGANHPVKDLETGCVSITSQNHGFCVDIDSLNQKEVRLTQINLNDNTLEGLEHKKIPAFSVQYHPEASPGPHDSDYLFQRFYDMVKKHA